MQLRAFVITIPTILALSSSAWAHPGHGSGGGSTELIHYLRSPLHWTMALLTFGLIAVLGKLIRSEKLRRASRATSVG